MKKNNSILLVFLVAISILVPQLLSILFPEPDTFAITENRNKESFPSINTPWSLFPLAITKYYKDRIPFRGKCLFLTNKILSMFLPPYGKSVIIGKDSFLFYNPKTTDDPYLQYIGADSYNLTNSEVNNICNYFKFVANDVQSKNIECLVVIPPDKITIYSDKLPIKRSAKRSASHLMLRLPSVMKELAPSVNFLYLEQHLLKCRNKIKFNIYYPQDTHWNHIGAYCGMEAILNSLNSSWPQSWPLPEVGPYDLKPIKTDPDLIRMGINLEIPRSLPDYFPQDFPQYPIQKCNLKYPNFYTVNQYAPDSRTVVVFRDSFMTALQPYISSYFKKVYFLGRLYDSQSVNEYNPDLVIVERIARLLVIFKNYNENKLSK